VSCKKGSAGKDILSTEGGGGSEESVSNGGEESRKLLEARKIIDIQEGLGFCFSGNTILEVEHGVELENNDRAKIEDWERRKDV
jgi:hypothetical protein